MDKLDQIQNKSEFNIRLKFLTNAIPMNNIKYENFKVNRKLLKNYTLKDKTIMAKARIKEFIEHLPNQQIMISFSGGKDSCVLRDLVYKVQDDMNIKRSNLLISAEIFHPLTSKFIAQILSNGDEILHPIKSFESIIKEKGYPIISKQVAQKIWHIRNTRNHSKYIRAIFGLDGNTFATLPLKYIHFLDKKFVNYEISHQCCNYIKGNIKHDKRPVFVGTTIEESRLRRNSWLKYGCIQYFNGKPDVCKPLSLFTEKDIWDYINKHHLHVSEIYKNHYQRSGCVCCGFGISLEEELKKHGKLSDNRFELLYKTNKPIFLKIFNHYKMWKPLADCLISLNNIDEKKLLIEFDERKKAVKEWYNNINVHLNKILDEIESRNPSCWTKTERNWIFNKYLKAKFVNCKL